MSRSAPGRTVGFCHVGLSVRDLDRSVAWHREVLGLELLDRRRRDEPYLGQVTGVPGVHLDIALLEEPTGLWEGGRSVYLIDPDGIRIELVQPGPDGSSRHQDR